MKTLRITCTHNPAIFTSPKGMKIVVGGAIIEVDGEDWPHAYVAIEGKFSKMNIEWTPAFAAKPVTQKRTWIVKSNKDSITSYLVTEHSDDRLTCTCPGFMYRKKCRHITQITETVG